MTSTMCVALAIWFESASSNQPIDDQYSIALVVVGRAHDYGWKPCDVVFEPKQFSSLNHALDDLGNLKPEYLPHGKAWRETKNCLLYTSDAADDLLCVDLGGRRII